MKGNGLGPENKGPGTGRKLGFCYGWGKSGYANTNVAGTIPKPKGQFGHMIKEQSHKVGELSV